MSVAARSPHAKQRNGLGIMLPYFPISMQLLPILLQNSELGALLLAAPRPADPVQNPTHIPPHGAELLPSTRNITAILPTTIHLCLN